ncbi:DUF2062 domain-containing protein [Cerasicoccus maritimus]|uniref:DUF2062 domain-containing protein n=1 Tax=Cerasicoccus maritimus TaxID=490089 RepID=UPI002852A701|nr:DUF2062 domain-containing protein [Cerasicoccus maritimus]
MTADEKHRHEYFKRIRRAKRWLRPLPRRATLHRYPVLGWFAGAARKRSYLWSFRREDVVPAIYIGCILSLLPIYGIQVATGFLLAIVFRCNLMVMVATQFITNPITAGPLYLAGCYVGLLFFQMLGADIPGDSVYDFAMLITHNLKDAFLSIVGPSTMRGSMEALSTETGMSLAELVGLGFKATFIGGTIIGYFIGFFLSLIYQFTARRASAKMFDLRTQYHKVRLRESEALKTAKKLKNIQPNNP